MPKIIIHLKTTVFDKWGYPQEAVNLLGNKKIHVKRTSIKNPERNPFHKTLEVWIVSTKKGRYKIIRHQDHGKKIGKLNGTTVQIVNNIRYAKTFHLYYWE
jgi:hypothetical protein